MQPEETMSIPLRILLVEDSENDAILLKRKLEQGGFAPILERVDTAAGMQKALDKTAWDIVIADYVMPGFNALGALEIFKQAQIDIPFIVVSGAIIETMAVDCMRAGASDYVMKDNL